MAKEFLCLYDVIIEILRNNDRSGIESSLLPGRRIMLGIHRNSGHSSSTCSLRDASPAIHKISDGSIIRFPRSVAPKKKEGKRKKIATEPSICRNNQITDATLYPRIFLPIRVEKNSLRNSSAPGSYVMKRTVERSFLEHTMESGISILIKLLDFQTLRLLMNPNVLGLQEGSRILFK